MPALCFLSAGCAPLAGGRTSVVGVGADDLLKLRTGPGLEYGIVLGLPDGTELIRRDCVTEVGQLWCRVSPAEAPSVEGYVSADYLLGS
nr:SH3 domain-containing protein [Sulfitobacter maritimus]